MELPPLNSSEEETSQEKNYVQNRLWEEKANQNLEDQNSQAKKSQLSETNIVKPENFLGKEGSELPQSTSKSFRNSKVEEVVKNSVEAETVKEKEASKFSISKLGQLSGEETTRKTIFTPTQSQNPEKKNFIAEYKIIKILGQGAVGKVYKCFDEDLQRIVAVKLLREDSEENQKSKQRFEIEARSIAQLSHPNIVQVYRYGKELFKKRSFLVMEFIEGESLENVLVEKKRLSISETLSYLKQIAAGLQYSHQKGILHRDIKLANILISKKNQAKLADFGLAKFIETPEILNEEKELDSFLPNVTHTGTVMGTPLYMSPERTYGINDDPRSDIYALGMLLYYCLTGSPPFERDTMVKLLLAQREEEPIPLTEILPDCPQALTQIFEKASAKALDDRYQSVGEFLEEIEAFQNEEKREKELFEKKQLSLLALNTTKSSPLISDSAGALKIFLMFLFLLFLTAFTYFYKDSFTFSSAIHSSKTPLKTRALEAKWISNQETRLFGKFISIENEEDFVSVKVGTNVLMKSSQPVFQKEIIFSKADWETIYKEHQHLFSSEFYLAFSGKAIIEEDPYLLGHRYSFLPVPDIKRLHRYSEERSPVAIKSFSESLIGETVQAVGMIALIKEEENGDLQLLLVDSKTQIQILLSAQKLVSLEKDNYSPRIGDIIHTLGILEQNPSTSLAITSEFVIRVNPQRKDNFFLTEY